MVLARRIMSSPPGQQENVHTETISGLLEALNTRHHFAGVLDLSKKLQQWMTDYAKDLAGNDLTRMMRLVVQADGNGIDWRRLSMILPNINGLRDEHLSIFDAFLALCLRGIFVKVPLPGINPQA